MEKGQRRDTRQETAGRLRQSRPGRSSVAGGGYRGTSEGRLRVRAVTLGGAGRMAAELLLHLLLINNLFGARTQLLCVIWAPVESSSPQLPSTEGVLRDLAALSSWFPKIKEL